MQSAAYRAPINPTNRSDARDFPDFRAFLGAVSLQRGRFLHGRPPIRDAEQRSRRPDEAMCQSSMINSSVIDVKMTHVV